MSTRQNLQICYAIVKNKPCINNTSLKKKEKKKKKRVAFGVKHGGKQVPKIDFSTRLVYLQCTVWVDAAVYFPSLPFFLSHPCFLVTDERVRCALFVHRNINHSICLVCISENFHVSLLPNHDRRSTAERTYRQYAACFECSYSSSHAEKARAGGCGTCSMC